jgi:hypothetical protein
MYAKTARNVIAEDLRLPAAKTDAIMGFSYNSHNDQTALGFRETAIWDGFKRLTL